MDVGPIDFQDTVVSSRFVNRVRSSLVKEILQISAFRLPLNTRMLKYYDHAL